MTQKRYNRGINSQDVRNVLLGADKFDKGKKVFYIERMSFGVTIIGANTRYGKTIVVKNLYTEIGQVRPVIILDYLGEHTLSRWPNFLSQDHNAKCLPKLVEARLGPGGARFKISQFNKAEDWVSLSFADRGSLLMAEMAGMRDAHRDDPKLFKQMLEDIPQQAANIPKFQETWGFYMPTYRRDILESAQSLYNYLYTSEFFADPDEPTPHFGKMMLRHHYININFGLDKSEEGRARAIAGKVLEQIKEYIEFMDVPPLIVVEEADVLAPNLPESQIRYSSVSRLTEFVLKLQKKRIEIMFVVQDLSRLHYAIVENAHNLILGQQPSNNPYGDKTKYLRWDIDSNYREFLYVRKGVGTKVFIPADSMTMY